MFNKNENWARTWIAAKHLTDGQSESTGHSKNPRMKNLTKTLDPSLKTVLIAAPIILTKIIR